MPVPTLISELSQTANSNSPSGTESPITTDNYLRAHAAFIAELRDGIGATLAPHQSPLGTAALPSYTFVGDTDTGAYSSGADQYAIATAGVLRMSVNAAGEFSVGSTSPVTGSGLTIAKNITGATTSYGTRITSQVQSGVTTGANMYNSAPTTAAAAFTLTNLRHFHAQTATLGSGSAVTNQYAFVAGDMLGATNNYGFRGAVAASATNWNLYMDGTAKNHLAGNLLCGTTTENASGAKLQTADGITFPATQVASSDVNTLDDYEEGTFLPIVYGDGTAGSGTYLRQAGSYTKIGRLVAFNLILETSAHTGTGNIMLGNLPFSIDAGDIYPAFASLAYSLTLTAGNVSMLVQGVPGTATGVLTQTPTGSTNPVSVPMDQTVLLAISGTYMST